MLSFGDLIQSLSGIGEWIENTVKQIGNIFADVNLSILYNWLPTDISGVITAVIGVMIVLALIGLLKKLILFFG